MFISSCCSTPQSHLFGDMRSHLINFPSLSYLKIQQPVAPFGKFSSVTVKGLLDSLVDRKFPRFGRNRALGRKEIEFLSNNANFQFFRQLALSIKNSWGYFQRWKNKEKLWRGGNRYQLMKKAWKVYVPIVKIHFTTLKMYVPALCCATLDICEEEKLINCLHRHVKMLFRPQGCLCYHVGYGQGTHKIDWSCCQCRQQMGKIWRTAHGQEQRYQGWNGRNSLSPPCVGREINLTSGQEIWKICSLQTLNVNFEVIIPWHFWAAQPISDTDSLKQSITYSKIVSEIQVWLLTYSG